LVCKDTQTLELLEVSGGLKDRYEQQAGLLPANLLLTALNIANDCDLGYRLARNKRLHVEMALLKMTYINRAFKLTEEQLSAQNPEKKTTDVSTAAPPPLVPEPSPEPVSVSSSPSDVTAEDTVKEPVAPPPVAKEEPVAPVPVKGTKHVLPKMKKLDAMLEEIKEEEANATVEEMAEPITLERTREAWKAYIDQCEQESVKVIMRNAELGLLGEDELKVTVSSNLAENTVRQEDGLIEHLRTTLKSSGLMMRVEVDKSSVPEPPKPKRLMTSKEKYLSMRETNPLLQEIQKRFDLRPDE
jgi:DNA polymerase-3 subunit gamma/tau